MGRLRGAWQWLGHVPGAVALGAFFVVLVLAKALVDDSAKVGVSAIAGGVLVLYCLARPWGGWNVWVNATVPAGFAWVFHDIFGLSRWLAVLSMPVVVWSLWADDRAHGRGETAGGDADLNESTGRPSSGSEAARVPDLRPLPPL